MQAEPGDEPTKVTAWHLRHSERVCSRRLALDQQDQRGNRRSSRRFEVANRLGADARLAHTDGGPPDSGAFVVPVELFPEQQRLYAAAARGYLACFGARPARLVDADAWSTDVPALHARLVGDVGIPLERTDRRHELRVLRVSGRAAGVGLDSVDLRFAALRSEAWAGAALDVVVADLLNASTITVTLDLTEELPAAHAWLAERLDVLRERVRSPRASVGPDCQGCSFVAGCPPHTRP